MKSVIMSVIIVGLISPAGFGATDVEKAVPLRVQQPQGSAPPPPVYEQEPAPEYQPLPPPARQPAPPPMVEESPAPPIATFVQPPLMVWDPRFGMYIALGSPYDLFFYGGYYYVFINGGWHRSLHYNGPWIFTERVWLPPVFQRYGIEGIRHYREEFYRDYHRHPEAFRDRLFDHHEDRFRGAYDRGFMDRNRDQMKRDREYHERYNKAHER